jgi:hypothetical protein
VELGIMLTGEVRRPRNVEQRRSASSSDVNVAWQQGWAPGLGWLHLGGRAPWSEGDGVGVVGMEALWRWSMATRSWLRSLGLAKQRVCMVTTDVAVGLMSPFEGGGGARCRGEADWCRGT